MEERWTFGPSFFLHLLDQRFEAGGLDRFGLGGDLCGEGLEHLGRGGEAEDLSVLRDGEGGGGIKVQNGGGARGQLVEFVDRVRKRGRDVREPGLDRRRQLRDGERALIERLGQGGDALGLGLLDVVAIEPVELFEVEDRRRWGDAGEIELLRPVRWAKRFRDRLRWAPSRAAPCNSSAPREARPSRGNLPARWRHDAWRAAPCRDREWSTDGRTRAPASRALHRARPAWEYWRDDRRRG